jgi:transposase InsO family protein
VQTVPDNMLHPNVKTWPFWGWGLDFVGEVHLASSKGHRFMLVATDCFTKWTEVVPLKNMIHKELIKFVEEHIIHQFGISQMLTIDQGATFMSHQFQEFAGALKIRLLNSSPYYAQANRQAESSNKVLIKLIMKKIDEYPKRWHEVLSEALWAHRTSKHSATKVTLFELVYGQEAVLPVEINLQTCRIDKQDTLSTEEYTKGMMDKIDELLESRFRALEEIDKEKLWAAKAYNRRVKEKSFIVRDLVWKTILPLGSHDRKFGKWSPSWEGPLKVTGVVPGNAYLMETIEGQQIAKAISGKYLKKYYPSVWQEA